MKTFTAALAFILLITLSLTTLNLQAMEKKNVEKITVLKYTITTSISEMIKEVGNLPNDLMAKATELGLEITGPQLWQYSGSDGNPESVFILDICIPVKEAKGDPGKFSFVVLPAISCVSEIHKGPWKDLSNTYQRIMGEMSRKGMTPGSLCREVYMICDYENQENCITEVQIETFVK